MSSKPKTPVPKPKSVNGIENSDPPDEIVLKFTKRFHKTFGNRESPNIGSPKSVSFNPETVETSFGGSQTPGRIKDTSVHLDFTHVDAKLRHQAQESNESEDSQEVDTMPQPVKALPRKSGSKVSESKSADSKEEMMSQDKDIKSTPKGPGTPSSVRKWKPQMNGNGSITKPLHSRDGDSTLKAKAILNAAKSKMNGGLPNQFKPEPLDNGKQKGDMPTPRKSLLNGSVNSSFQTPEKKRSSMDVLKKASLGGTPECFNPVAFETPRGKPRYSGGDTSRDTSMESDASRMTVAVRVRPFSTRETETEGCRCVVSMVDNETTVFNDKTSDEHRFRYDYSFWSFDKIGGEYADQEYVYGTLAQPMLSTAFEGYNTCLFAYGQTGSGKSYSIHGHGEENGIIPRFCEELFGRIDSGLEGVMRINVEISFFEIYNEKIHDLLGQNKDKTTGKRPCLRVRESPVYGPHVQGLSTHLVKSFEDIQGWLSVGNKHRATAATGMNDKSSRSHSVFTMVMTQTKVDVIEDENLEHNVTSKINLVDLAGSERQSLAKTSGDRLREGASINKSLHTLGKVISFLATMDHSKQHKKPQFVPYRDSVLTWLLKESLGGNSKTAMLATISPANLHMEETLSTLRYASQARSIINSAKVNEDSRAGYIRGLQAEIERLRNEMEGMPDNNELIKSSNAEIASLRNKLQQKELEMNEMTKSWQERLKRSEEQKAEESRLLEKSGIALKIDNKLPNLVNLNEDPQLSEMLLYIIREGESKVGRQMENSDADIQLNCLLISDNHCTFKNTGKKVILIPEKDAQTYVNGDLIVTETTLNHGDRVILGGNQFFRFNHPQEVQQGRKSLSNKPKDFEFAQQEFSRVQNEK